MTTLILALVFLPLVILASLRLTRLITTDWLGEWLIVAPIKRWAWRFEGPELQRRSEALPRAATLELVTEYDPSDPFTWQAKFAKGLDCPFCVGYWVGSAVLVITTAAVLYGAEALVVAWGVLLGTFALNYLVGHVSNKID